MSHHLTDVVDMALLFCTVAKQGDANTDAAAWDPDTGGAETFESVRLSANGLEPASHIGCCSAVNAAMKTAIQASTNLAGTYWTSTPETWDGALTDMGLQVILWDGTS